MRSKVAVGIALALTVALAGCQGSRDQGGGGGTGDKTMQPQGANRPGGSHGSPAGNTAGTQGSLGGTPAKAPQGAVPKTQAGADQSLQTATRHASAARTSVAEQDWVTAKNELARVKEDLRAAEQRATGDVQADLRSLRQQAEHAERSVQQHSASAKTELDKLVTRLNRVAVREEPIRAGGGKPGPTGGSTSRR